MTLLFSESGKTLTQEQLNQKAHVHEFILSKDHSAIDVQIAQICELVPLHPLTLEDCRKGNQRAKFERYPDYIFIVLHHFDVELSQISELHLVLQPGRLLLIADNLPPNNSETWRRYLNIDAQLSLADIIHNIFDSCVDSAERRIARLADLVSQSEALIIDEHFNPRAIVAIKQHSLRFQRAVIGAFTVVREFLAIADVSLDQQLLFGNILDHQERLRHELDFFHSDLVALFDVYWGATSFYTNEQMKRLTLLATVVVPLGFWTSFFGMNFEALPFREPWFFYLAITLMLGSIGAVFFYLKRRGLFHSRRARLNKPLLELLK